MNLRIIQRFRHTIVALEESSAEDASFFQAEICFTFGRILFTRENFFLRVRKWLIHYAACFIRAKTFFIIDLFFRAH